MASEMDKSLSSIAKGAGIIFLGIIIANVLGIANQILMGRFLGPEKYGLFYLGISIITILCVLPQFGLGAALTQFIPYYSKKNRYDKVRTGIYFSLKFGAVVSIIVSIVLFILSDVIANEFFDSPELGNVIRILCIALPFWSLHYTLGLIMQAFKKPNYFTYIENILMKSVQISIFVVLILIGYRLFGALFAYIAASFVATLAYGYILFYKLFPTIKILIQDKGRKASVERELVSISWPLFLAGLTYYFMVYTDRILLGIYMNPADVGIYTAAFTIASLMLFIFYSFSFNFRPVVAEYFATRDIPGIQKLYSSITKWIFLLTFPAIIYLIYYSEEVILLIYGDSFSSGSSALIVLSMGIAMNGLTGLTGEVLVAIRKTRLNLISEVIGVVSNIGINIILIPSFGLIGAAIGTSISISLRNLSSLSFVYRELKIHPYNRTYFTILFASIASMVSISFLLTNLIGIPFAYIVVIPIFLTVYFIILFKTRCFNDFDISLFRGILNKIGLMKSSR